MIGYILENVKKENDNDDEKLIKYNRPRRRARHRYAKYKKCPGKISTYSKLHLSNIWGSIH